MSYKWKNPAEWLRDAYEHGRIKAQELLDVVCGLDSDTIEENFEIAMENDGYFVEPLTPTEQEKMLISVIEHCSMDDDFLTEVARCYADNIDREGYNDWFHINEETEDAQ